MVKRPDGISAFEFSVLAGLRAVQLSRGCSPRVDPSEKLAVTAQHEIAQRKVVRAPNREDGASDPVE
jgi:DNA-directed RNA polymerase subunit K/omega